MMRAGQALQLRLRLAALIACIGMASAGYAGTGVEQLVTEGIQARDSGELVLALQKFEAASDVAPDDADVLLLMGLARGYLSQYDGAREALGRAIALAPERADLHVAAARIELWANRPEAAKAQIARAAAIAPWDPEVDATRTELSSRLRGNPGAIEFSASAAYSTFSGDARAPWRDYDFELALLPHRAERYVLNVETGEHFGTSDIHVGIGVDRLALGNFSVRADAGVTDDADFRERVAAGAGLSRTVRQGGARMGASVLGADIRARSYESGTVYSFSPSFEQYLVDGRAWVSGRGYFTRAETGLWQQGWLARLDVQAARHLRGYLGYSDAPETFENVTLPSRTHFVGMAYAITARCTIDLSYAHEERSDLYTRRAGTAGLSCRR